MNRLLLIATTLTLLLAACGSTSVTVPTTPAATTGTVNGVRIVDPSTYQLGFTPLSGNDVVTTASLKTATVKSISEGAATATICGQVQTQNVITTAISLDSTGSMADTDPGLLRRAAAQAFVKRMGPQDRAAVLSFDGYTASNLPKGVSYLWQDFTSDQALLNTAVNKATFAGGGTPLYGAIIDASTQVAGVAGANGTVLILTDGDDSGYSATAQNAIDAAKKNGTKVYAIGLDASNTLDFTALEDLTAATGGLFQKATSATDLQGFFDNVYNAFRAQGCVQLNFTQKPAAGTVVTGTMVVTVTAPDRASADIEVRFTVTVR
ncbi:VWA domain-containing protein (plasmid) [Deinococcus sp. KNUC1210]|uniref:vWA domain-containing protein n=1 Tax=Deinococcus sp. KNUC1210 TaxID=2917691 RepID=UPI001EEF85F4|nr:VWA domain-containing protein [Deinococcus sp. KNUC1210]ULH14034.1 VWA domain-containing protein [Deinococcus sp. KNUC1210]